MGAATTGERTREDGTERDVQFLHLHIHNLLARIVLFFLVVIHPPEKTRVPLVPRILASDLCVGESLVLVLPQPSPSAHTRFPKPALGQGRKQTFNLLFSFCSSLQSFSNFSFSDTVLLSSFLLLSLSFCSWSPRFLFLMLSRSCRFMSDSRSEHRFVRCSIFWMSLILDVWVCSSRFAFLTSRSATQSATKLDIKPPGHGSESSRAISDSHVLALAYCRRESDLPGQPAHNIEHWDVHPPISASWSFSPAASSSSCEIRCAINLDASVGSGVFFCFPFFPGTAAGGAGACRLSWPATGCPAWAGSVVD